MSQIAFSAAASSAQASADPGEPNATLAQNDDAGQSFEDLLNGGSAGSAQAAEIGAAPAKAAAVKQSQPKADDSAEQLQDTAQTEQQDSSPVQSHQDKSSSQVQGPDKSKKDSKSSADQTPSDSAIAVALASQAQTQLPVTPILAAKASVSGSRSSLSSLASPTPGALPDGLQGGSVLAAKALALEKDAAAASQAAADPAKLAATQATASATAGSTAPATPATPVNQPAIVMAAAALSALKPAASTTSSTSGAPGKSRETKGKTAEIAGATSSTAADSEEVESGPQSNLEGIPSVSPLLSSGTGIAMQSSAMQNAAQFAKRQAASHSPVQQASVASAAAQKQGGAQSAAKSATPASGSAQQSTPATPTASFSVTSSMMVSGRTTTAASSTSATTETFAATAPAEIAETAARMTTDGSTRAEIQVNLADGQQITVRLQMIQGAVHPTFKTSSPELRQAIEQAWGGFRSAATDRGLDIATPVFESHGSESNFADLTGQGGQQQAQDQQAESAAQNIRLFPPSATSAATTINTETVIAAPAIPAGGSVQVYA